MGLSGSMCVFVHTGSPVLTAGVWYLAIVKMNEWMLGIIPVLGKYFFIYKKVTFTIYDVLFCPWNSAKWYIYLQLHFHNSNIHYCSYFTNEETTASEKLINFPRYK